MLLIWSLDSFTGKCKKLQHQGKVLPFNTETPFQQGFKSGSKFKEFSASTQDRIMAVEEQEYSTLSPLQMVKGKVKNRALDFTVLTDGADLRFMAF